jgi:hypothetical protein
MAPAIHAPSTAPIAPAKGSQELDAGAGLAANEESGTWSTTGNARMMRFGVDCSIMLCSTGIWDDYLA